MMIVDEFESRFDSDYIFQGSKDDVVELWLNNKSRWYPDVLVTKNNLGEMWCSVTGVICENLHTMPLFCLGGMKHVSCTSGETLHVCEAVKRDDILPLKHHTQAGREDSRKMDYCI